MLDEDSNGEVTLQELRAAVAKIVRCSCLCCAKTGTACNASKVALLLRLSLHGSPRPHL